ncbi:MAG: flavodoxin [Desulfovibrio sp.]|nr:flavodoxin [Desulfovibrio sp.]
MRTAHLKILVSLSVTVFLLLAQTGLAAAAESTAVIYFSHTGNTKKLASIIHGFVGGDIIEIKPQKAYPRDYDTLTKQAKKEQEQGARPALAALPPLEAYTTVFLGYPNWWGTMPMPLFTLFETNNFNGKTIIPFCTHGGSRLGRSVEDIKELAPGATVLKGFSAFGRDLGNVTGEVQNWLEVNGIQVKH